MTKWEHFRNAYIGMILLSIFISTSLFIDYQVDFTLSMFMLTSILGGVLFGVSVFMDILGVQWGHERR